MESEGVRGDDPFGALKDNGGYTMNARGTSVGDGARGEDNLWTWETLARVTTHYVQFYWE